MAKTKLNWLNTLFLLGTLAAAVVAVPLHLYFNGFRWSEWLVALGMVFTIGTAISAGYHRLFSHKAYVASWPVRLFLLLFGAASFENSALKWSSDHRLHHRFVDDLEKDPYAIGKGFWYAHWTWVMEDKDVPMVGVSDLQKDPLVMWQHRYFFRIGAAVALIPVAIGLVTGNLMGHLVVGLLLRIVLTHHTTFLINSAAHVFGSRPYTDANSARDNWILAPLTYGEGFHNFHHMWQWDYRNGALWYQWDSTKWLLNGLAWAGLISKLRRVPVTAMERARIRMDEKRLLERLAKAGPRVTPLQDRLAAARERVDLALAGLQERREAWKTRKAEWKVQGSAKAEAWRAAKAEWKAGLALQRAELRAAWEEWKDAQAEARMVLVPA
jgi:stearoyl-CoA desaturase (delta-9 desaturase)